jgi:hypothetical protein
MDILQYGGTAILALKMLLDETHMTTLFQSLNISSSRNASRFPSPDDTIEAN